jgi:RNA polymerase sigma-70 factor, ECF subfamily
MAAEDSTETALVQRVLRGDEDAFVALYRRHRADVLRFCRGMTRSASFAEDVTQEVFLNLLESAHRFAPARGSLRAWLLGCARHLLLERWRYESRLTHTPPDEGCIVASDGEYDFAIRQRLERLHRAIVALAPAYREALVLCELGELSYAEAAAAIGCPIGTVRSRLHRARVLLAAELVPEEPRPASLQKEIRGCHGKA